jgi:hypothetical protein
MRRLLQIEFIKVKSYRAFWAILGIYALLFVLSTGIMGRMVPQNPAYSFFGFPDVWHHLAYVASYLNILPSILIIMLVANEYTFKTFRQNLIDGLSRKELIYSKFLLIAAVAFFCIFLIFIWGMARGIITGHFDTIGEMFQKMHFLFYLFLQIAGYMSLATLVALIFKRAAFSILIFLVYVVALERIIRWRMDDNIDRFFPMKAFGGLIPDISSISFQGLFETGMLSPEWTVVVAILYILAFFGASLLMMEKSNL